MITAVRPSGATTAGDASAESRTMSRPSAFAFQVPPCSPGSSRRNRIT